MIRLFILLFVIPLSAFANEEDPFDRVPTSHIKSNDVLQDSVIGTFCWHYGNGDHHCVDTGLVSPKESIEVKQGDPIALTMPNQKNLRLVQYSFIPVNDSMIVTDEVYPDRYYWDAGPSAVAQLELTQSLSISSELKPGLYVLSVSAWWNNYDDANHGFLINVSP